MSSARIIGRAVQGRIRSRIEFGDPLNNVAMQNILNIIKFSEATLVLTFLIPFTFFAVHTKYKNDDTRRGYELFLIITSIILAALTISKFATGMRGMPLPQKLLMLSHIGPCLLTIMCIAKFRELNRKIELLTEKGSPAPQVVVERAPDHTAQAEAIAEQFMQNDMDPLSWSELVLSSTVAQEIENLLTLLQNPEAGARLGVQIPKGILLQGPPGTGKTSIAKLVAKTAGLNLFQLHTSEILSGTSTASMWQMMQKAAAKTPAAILIDEIDLLGKSRANDPHPEADKTLRQLLQVFEVVDRTPGLYLLATTNRADLVDEALKRPGRLTKTISTQLPNCEERNLMFELYLAKLPVNQDIVTAKLAERSDGASGAVIRAICNQAGMNALQRAHDRQIPLSVSQVGPKDVDAAVKQYMDHKVQAPRAAANAA